MVDWKKVSIILAIVVILQFCFVGWMFNIGTEIIEKENKCAIDICGDYELYDAYDFDETTNACYCFKSGEVVDTTYMGE